MSKKIHNPKSQSPAVYIPCWLIQVPVKLLSHGAKLVYGRLSQWSNETGQVFRSVPQLAQELGMCESSVEKFQRELRETGLIGTYHPQAGGLNYFEFYHHPWMDEPLNQNLVYKQDKSNPPYKHEVPPVQSYGTPPYKHEDINIKEIKEIKKDKDLLCERDKKKFKIRPNDYQETLFLTNDEDIKAKSIRFEEFWTLYPNKKNKNRAKAMWVQSNLDEKANAILKKLKEQIENEAQWKEPKFIPNPSNYINDQRWEDNITKISNKPNKKIIYDHKSTDWIKTGLSLL